MSIKKYKVVQCPHCGSVQSTSSEKIFKCVSCGKSRQMFSEKSGLNIKIFDSFDHPKQATLYVQEYKRVKAEKAMKQNQHF